MSTQTLVNNLITVIINPLIYLFFAVGLLVFFWGVIEFLLALNVGGESSKETGKQHMLWGLIGMFIIVSSYAIINAIASNICNGGLAGCVGTFK